MLDHGFFSTYLVSIPIIAWITGQLIKVCIRLIFIKNTSKKYLWGSGGMPSVHSAFVIALCTALYMKHGLTSEYFIIALSFSGIVLYDAMHVRYQTGVHAQLFNALEKKHLLSSLETQKIIFPLHEHVGHTLLEVFVGALLGFVIAVLLSLY